MAHPCRDAWQLAVSTQRKGGKRLPRRRTRDHRRVSIQKIGQTCTVVTYGTPLLCAGTFKEIRRCTLALTSMGYETRLTAVARKKKGLKVRRKRCDRKCREFGRSKANKNMPSLRWEAAVTSSLDTSINGREQKRSTSRDVITPTAQLPEKVEIRMRTIDSWLRTSRRETKAKK